MHFCVKVYNSIATLHYMAQNPRYPKHKRKSRTSRRAKSLLLGWRNVLSVSIIQLRRCMDKESRTLIMTLTSEVRLSNKTLFFNRSLVHSSARDQLRKYHLCDSISEDTLWVQILPYLLKFCWISRKFFKTVSLPMTPISGMFGLL